jgi:hypothetical protein
VDHSIFILHRLVILLETGHYAQVGLALRAVVLGFPPEYPATAISRVPAEVARQRRALSGLRTVTKLLHGVVTVVLELPAYWTQTSRRLVVGRRVARARVVVCHH